MEATDTPGMDGYRRTMSAVRALDSALIGVPCENVRASVPAGESGPAITLPGEVDVTDAAELSELVTAPLSGGTLHLTVDAAGLSFADSATSAEVRKLRAAAPR